MIVVKSGLVVALALTNGMIVPSLGSAQTVFRVTPALDAALVYDSNLFAKPSDRRGDLISRLTPTVDAEYRSSRITLAGRYSLDSERFAHDVQLTRLDARQAASLSARYRASQRLFMDTETSFATTQTPGEFNTLAGFIVARASARRVAARSASTYHLDPRTKATVEYGFSDDHITGGVGVRSHSAITSGERRISRRNLLSADYRFRRMDFGPADVNTSHSIGAGWTHELTRHTTLALRGGPRLDDGELAPEVSASIAHRLASGELSLAYSRAQTTLIGLAGAVDSEQVSASAVYGRPTSLQLRVEPAVMQTTRTGLAARAYRLALGVTVPIASRVAVGTAYDVTVQDGDLYNASTPGTITRHVLMMNLTALARPLRP